MDRYDCPCCGAEGVYEEERMFEICPVCRWEDDSVQYDDPDYDVGANHVSLNEARKAFAEGKPIK